MHSMVFVKGAGHVFVSVLMKIYGYVKYIHNLNSIYELSPETNTGRERQHRSGGQTLINRREPRCSTLR